MILHSVLTVNKMSFIFSEPFCFASIRNFTHWGNNQGIMKRLFWPQTSSSRWRCCIASIHVFSH